MNKRGLILFLSSVLAMNFAYAQEDGFLAPFNILLEWAAKTELTSGDTPIIVAKILLGIGIFALVYYGLGKFLKETSSSGRETTNNRVAIPVALSIAAIAFIGIPLSLVKTLISLYGGVLMLILFGIIIILVYLGGKGLREFIGEEHPVPYHIIQLAIFAVAVVMLTLMKTQIKINFNVFNVALSWIDLIIFVCFLICLWHLFAFVFSLIGNPKTAAGVGPGIEMGREAARGVIGKLSDRWRKRETNQFIREKNEMKLIEGLDARNKQFIEVLELTMKNGKINTAMADAILDNFRKTVLGSAKDAQDYFRKLGRPEKKQYAGMGKIEKILRKEGKTTEQLDAMERMILTLHEETADILEHVIIAYNSLEPRLVQMRNSIKNWRYGDFERKQLEVGGKPVDFFIISKNLRDIMIDIISNTLKPAQLYIEDARKKQRQVITELEGLIIEVNKLKETELQPQPATA